MSNIEPVKPDYETLWKLSQRVHQTPFVPKGLQGKPESVLACVLYGAELGLGPMQSLNSIHVIEGRTAMSPELMRAMVARHGHRIDVVENSNTACELKGSRVDTGSTATVRWTIDDAKNANLAGKDNWKKYPRAMLMARATSELCRILFPDIVAGLSYTPEEVASIEGVEYVPTDVRDDSDIQDAEIVEEETVKREFTPIVNAEVLEELKESKKKIGSVATVVKNVIEDGLPVDNGPSFEEKVLIAESWGKWPYVKAVVSVAAKKMGMKPADFPISHHELAAMPELWAEVKRIMDLKE